MTPSPGKQSDDLFYEDAITYAVSVLRRPESKDWQEAQHALANHPTLSPWLRSRQLDGDDLAEIQAIISEAEARIADFEHVNEEI
jgi:hypothetical protein